MLTCIHGLKGELSEFWKKLVEYDQHDYIMCCKLPEMDDYNQVRNLEARQGLIAGHAYSVITVLELSNGVRLLGLRNPWGSVEWLGDYGDDSDVWTEELRMEAASSSVLDHLETPQKKVLSLKRVYVLLIF